MLHHVGSARDEVALGVLMARARTLLADPGQGAFELEVESSVPVAALLPAPAPAALLPEVDPATAGPVRARAWIVSPSGDFAG